MLFLNKKKSEILCCSFFLCIEAFCFAQEVQIKIPFSVKNLSWNNSSSCFAYSEDSYIFIRDAHSFELVNSINDEKVSSFLFSSEGNLNNDVLLTLSETGNFSVWDFYSQNEKNALCLNIQCENNLQPTCVSFSKNSDYIALADTDNAVTIFFKLRYTRQTLKKTIQAHEKEIFGLSFDAQSQYLVSSSIENKAKIWSLKDNSLVSEIPFYAGMKIPAVFSSDSRYVLALLSEKSLGIYNVDGSLAHKIETKGNIKQIGTLPLTNLIAVLNDKNILEIYYLENFAYEGYIPPYTVSAITSFAFNSDSNYLLVGHEDGTIFKFLVEKVFLKPNEEPPALRIVTREEKPSQDDLLTKSENDSKSNVPIATKDAVKGTFSIIPSYTPFNSFVFSLGASKNSYPFSFSGNGNGEFHYGKAFSPMFFGVGLGLSFTLPIKDFPYSYSVNGEVVQSPYLLGVSCYIPLGVLLKPWDSEVYFTTVVKLGCKAYSFLLFASQGVFPSSLTMALYGASSIGIFYKNIGIEFLIEFDTVSGYYPSLSLLYQHKLKNGEGRK